MDKPFIAAAENNREPILQALAARLSEACSMLEIGAGTGQHAAYFATALPHLQWQPTDLSPQLQGIKAWVDEAGVKNLRAPIELDVAAEQWPITTAGGVYTANTVHYMPWASAGKMLAGIARILEPGGRFFLYGPFNRAGEFTSEGNRRLDQWLRELNDEYGLRDLDALVELAGQCGLELQENLMMPANNHLLVWGLLANHG